MIAFESFISVAILSLVLLSFQKTQWLGFLGAVVLGLIFPFTTAIVGLIYALGYYFFVYKKKK